MTYIVTLALCAERNVARGGEVIALWALRNCQQSADISSPTAAAYSPLAIAK